MGRLGSCLEEQLPKPIRLRGDDRLASCIMLRCFGIDALGLQSFSNYGFDAGFLCLHCQRQVLMSNQGGHHPPAPAYQPAE